MKYEVEFTKSALRSLEQVRGKDRARIAKRIDMLAENPRPTGVKRLQGGQGEHRLRVGDFRIIYLIDDNRLLVMVIRLGDRKDIYR